MIKKEFEYSPNGLKINRVFTKENEDPFSSFNFEIRTSSIKNTDGSVVFENKQVEVPDFWSQVATDILAQKYFRKKGIPLKNKDGTPKLDENGNQIYGGETSIKQVAHRLAVTWKNWGSRYKYFASEKDAQIFYEELLYMITNQMVAPNSPQWFNTGLYEAYGITGRPQGHHYADPVTGEAKLSEDAYSHCQPHACFIQSVRDDLVNEGGIFDVLTKEARLFKYGSGTGTNFSTLRAYGEGLSGGGKSSGLMSFLSVFDRGAGSVKSGGTTRRAAKMVCLDLNHPDIESFIDWKMREEQKVASLVAGSKICDEELKNIMNIINKTNSTDIEKNPELKNAIKKALHKNVPINYINRVLQLAKQGVKEIPFVTMDTDFESEAYITVAGQNSNNSIRIPNKFFEILEKDGDWELINRTNKKVNRVVKAKELWKKLNYAAWMCADPGVQYDSTINEWHTCPKDGRINASNPCSEYMFLDDTACNLASINLIKFYDEKEKKFKIDEFKHSVRIWTIVLELSIVMAQFPAKQIAINSFLYRSLGLGFANIGSLVMRMGAAYDSDYGRAIAGGVSAIMGGESYRTSAELASVVGTFAKYESNKEDMLKVMRNHRRAAYGEDSYEDLTIKPVAIDQKICPEYMLKEAHKSWDDALDWGQKYGYRNAQVTVIAPTGTIGLVMDCDTTGIEPDFALVKFKKLVGGGYFKIVNRSVPKALEALNYTEEQIDSIINYCIGHGTLKGCPAINHQDLIQKGFTQEIVDKIELQLKSAFELKHAFSAFTIGSDNLKKLGFSEEQIKDFNLDVLKELGFSEEQIQKTEEYVCGTMTVEGAPELKDEHLDVFDCASKCGKKGTRLISYKGHMKMMAAVQPFISGAISKTINMDSNATIEDVNRVYLDSWKMMIKAVALYRDGSKLSQPLSASNPDENMLLALKNEDDGLDFGPKEASKVALENLKRGFTQEAKVGGQKITLTTTEFNDGSLAKIELTTEDGDETLKPMMESFAESVSLALENKVPLESFIDKFTFKKFLPSGVVQGHEAIRMSSSLVDYIFRVLGFEYLDRTDLVHIKDAKKKRDNPDKKNNHDEKEVSKEDAEILKAKAQGYTGEKCSNCGSMKMRRNGTCMLCEDCGTTTGCS